ncbi:hypothetical protein B0H14DRAFT_2823513, partial [Mycena olivaceomarginata]
WDGAEDGQDTRGGDERGAHGEERLPQVLGTSVLCWGCAERRASRGEDSRWRWRMRRRRKRPGDEERPWRALRTRDVLRVVLKSPAGSGVGPRGRYTVQDGRVTWGRDEGGLGDDERERCALPVRPAAWVEAGVRAGVVSSVSASYGVGGAPARMR